eukprot:g4893.t1
MTDRFAGFRYELHGSALQAEKLHNAVQDKAEAIGCFGWVQSSPQGTVVGEGRCSKRAAPSLKKWLDGQAALGVERAVLKDYPDTKIRYHFSHFRILDDARETCFREAPHQCAELAGSAGEGGRDEL